MWHSKTVSWSNAKREREKRKPESKQPYEPVARNMGGRGTNETIAWRSHQKNPEGGAASAPGFIKKSTVGERKGKRKQI